MGNLDSRYPHYNFSLGFLSHQTMHKQFKILFLVLTASFLILSWCLPPITLSKKTTEKSDSDSLPSVLLQSELIGIMDTTLSTLNGKIVDFNSNTPIQKQFISIKSGFKVHFMKTDSAGNFNFPFIPSGDYNIRINSKKYKSFTLDSLHLSSGEIRKVTIGMRKL